MQDLYFKMDLSASQGLAWHALFPLQQVKNSAGEAVNSPVGICLEIADKRARLCILLKRLSARVFLPRKFFLSHSIDFVERVLLMR